PTPGAAEEAPRTARARPAGDVARPVTPARIHSSSFTRSGGNLAGRACVARRGPARPHRPTSGMFIPHPLGIIASGFLIPMSKTAEWWRKDWMERHTYFLPRYDNEGRMVAE